LGTGFLMGTDSAATTGLLEQQSGGPFASASVSGSYALGTPFYPETQMENVIGQVTGNGSGLLSGTVDEINPPATSVPASGNLNASITTLAANGRGALTTTAPVPSGFPSTAVFYVVSPSRFRMISTDASDQHPNLYLFNH